MSVFDQQARRFKLSAGCWAACPARSHDCTIQSENIRNVQDSNCGVIPTCFSKVELWIPHSALKNDLKNEISKVEYKHSFSARF